MDERIPVNKYALVLLDFIALYDAHRASQGASQHRSGLPVARPAQKTLLRPQAETQLSTAAKSMEGGRGVVGKRPLFACDMGALKGAFSLIIYYTRAENQKNGGFLRIDRV